VSFTPGISVPIGSIEKALGQLWDESGESKTRASLINLAIYSEEQDSLESNNAVIQGIAGEHAMRALLIQADPTAQGSSAEAWISMNCYLRGAKGGEVCSEQISFELRGEAARSLQSVVFSHLDSDLPLILWWQADFRPPIDGKLWRWVDRLLFDSQIWQNPKEQFELVSKIAAISETRTILCDLNWTRTFPLRQAIAGIFDSSCALPELQNIKTLEVSYATSFRITALLLVGWLADRLGWKLTQGGEYPEFQDTRGGKISVALHQSAKGEEASISRVLLTSSRASFEALHEIGSDLYITKAQGDCLATATRKVRAPREDINELLLLELSRNSQHSLYNRAVKVVQSLWG